MSEDLGRGGGAGAGDPASFLQAKGLGPWVFVETEGLHTAAEGCELGAHLVPESHLSLAQPSAVIDIKLDKPQEPPASEGGCSC